MPEFAQPAEGLHPAEDLLDQFSLALADGIARVPRGPPVDARGCVFWATCGVMPMCRVGETKRPMSKSLSPATVVARAPREHQERRLTLPGAGRRGRTHIGHDPCRLSSRTWPRYASFASLPGPCDKLRVGVRRRPMRVILPRCPMEIDGRIPRIVGRRLGPAPCAESFLDSPTPRATCHPP